MTRILACVAVIVLGPGVSLTMAQEPLHNVNDGNALLRECGAALDAADNEPITDSDTLSRLDATALEDAGQRGSDMGQCLGLVIGVWHTHMLLVDGFESREAFCPPATISAGQMARIVHKYLQEHPVKLHNWDTVLILDAFIDTYPCR